jgi:hypothetical protein
MTREELEKARAWADEKLSLGQEPPWAWYQYMKLRETLDAILAGQAATAVFSPTENSPQLAGRPERHLRLVDEAHQKDISQPRHVGLPIQLPM